MAHRVPKSDETKFKALQLAEDGVPYSQIAKDLKVSKGAISGWVNDQALRDRWQRWKGAQKVRETVETAEIPPPEDDQPPEVVDMASWEAAQPCALGPRVMRRLVLAIDDGAFERIGPRQYDFSLAAQVAELVPEQLDAVAFAASRGEADATATMARLNAAAAKVLVSCRKALLDGDAKRESVRLALLELDRARGQDQAVDAAAPLSRFSDEDLEQLEASASEA